MTLHNRTFLKIGSWNIHGLRSKSFDKTNDPNFLREIKSYDILGLIEAKLESTENIHLPNYRSFYMSRPNEEKYPNSGGILILYNQNIKRVSFF